MKKKLKDTGIGKFLKEKAPKVLDAIGDILPSNGTLGIIKNVISQQPDLTPQEKELKSLRDLNSEFQSLKVQLGELSIQKNSVLKRVDLIRVEFESLENELIKKYGENSVINLEHGTITQNVENK